MSTRPPWEDYQTAAPSTRPPWEDYAPETKDPEPQGYWDKRFAAKKKGFDEVMGGVGETLPGAALAVINPMTYLRASLAAADVPRRMVKSAIVDPIVDRKNPFGSVYDEFAPDVAGVAGGVAGLGKRLLGFEGARGTGQAIGELLPNVIPVGKAAGLVGKYAQKTRAANIIKATGATKAADKLQIEKYIDEIDLPVSLGQGSLLSKTRARYKGLKPELTAAKKAQEGLPKVSAKELLDDVKSQRPAVPLDDRPKSKSIEAQFADAKNAETPSLKEPKPPARKSMSLESQLSGVKGSPLAKLNEQAQAAVTAPTKASPLVAKTARELKKLNKQAKAATDKPVVTETSLNRPLLNAIDSQLDELTKAAGVEQMLKPEVMQVLKEQAQSSANKAFRAAKEAGQEAGVGAQASQIIAVALQKALETNTGIPKAIRDRLTAANRQTAVTKAILKPMADRRLRLKGKPLLSRSTEMLFGRGVSPLLTGGAGAGLYFAGSPAMALAAVTAGSFMQSVLWNTLSASAKKHIAPILAEKGVQAAMQAAFQAHITANAAKPKAEATR